MNLLQPKPSILRTKLKRKIAEIAWHLKSYERGQQISREKGCHGRRNHHSPTMVGHHSPWQAPRPSRGSYCPALAPVFQTQRFGSRLRP